MLICGKDMWKRCIQSRFMPICVISTWKLPFAVGSISTSEPVIAAWHGSGSVKLRTLFQGISVSPESEKSGTGHNGSVRPTLDFQCFFK
jgi:hypothetical protein